MKLLIILSLILASTACTSKKKSYCDLVEKPIEIEAVTTDKDSK
ncbi:MAG: hypothetical protein ACRBBP_10215 [Bdellovibrionales bacterium]